MGTSHVVATNGVRFPFGGVYRGSVLCDLPVLKNVDQCHGETQSAGEVNHGP